MKLLDIDPELLVSVIIPVYNVQPYLREALDSVINQTYSNLEIIVVDDGSTDDSGKICDEYLSDDRVVVIHQENRGLSAARNAGLDLMKGKYVAFLDSDDAYHTDYIRKMMEAIVREKTDIVICGYIIIQKNQTHFFSNSYSDSIIIVDEGKYNRITALRFLIYEKINVAVWNKLYNSKLWDNIRFPDGQIFEDVISTLQIFDLCHYVYVIEDSLYYYRIRPNSITDTDSIENIRDQILTYFQWTSFIEERVPEIFTEYQLRSVRDMKFSEVLLKCIKSRDESIREYLKNEVTGIVAADGINSYGLKTRVAYRLFCFSPLLFRIAYQAYHLIKSFIHSVKS